MKDFLDYLFYKYYHFQVRVGNRDVAPFFSILMITFTLFLYIAIVFMLNVFFIFPNSTINIHPIAGVVIGVKLLVIFYFLFLFKSKYKNIIKKEELYHKSSLWAIFLPFFSFVMIIVCLILKMLQNQGRI